MDAALNYEAANAFSHKIISKGYYEALQCAMKLEQVAWSCVLIWCGMVPDIHGQGSMHTDQFHCCRVCCYV